MLERIAHRGKQVLGHIKRHKNIYWLAIITGLLWGCLKNNDKNKHESEMTYIVQAKDNIINILKDHNIIPSEEHIDHFKELNNLEDDILHIWQTIKIDLRKLLFCNRSMTWWCRSMISWMKWLKRILGSSCYSGLGIETN